MKISLTKTLPAVLPVAGREAGRYHASWSIKEIPGLEVRGAYSEKSPVGRHDGWLVGANLGLQLFVGRSNWSKHHGDDGEYDLARGKGDYVLALKIIDKLQGQVFPTRREALQAVEAALTLNEAEEKRQEG